MVVLIIFTTYAVDFVRRVSLFHFFFPKIIFLGGVRYTINSINRAPQGVRSLKTKMLHNAWHSSDGDI